MKFKEIETKYRADSIVLSEFISHCEQRPGVVPRVLASGYDRFYRNLKDSTSFGRHRYSDTFNQLTFKRKSTDKNNFIRTEHNVMLDPNTKPEQISALFSEFGYEYEFSLFKSCWIYSYDTYNLVYYIIYDDNLKELDRFMEIEMAEEYPWRTEEEAWEELTKLESELSPVFDISAQKRIRLSLYEMNRPGR